MYEHKSVIKPLAIALLSSIALAACTERESTVKPPVEAAQHTIETASAPALDFDCNECNVRVALACGSHRAAAGIDEQRLFKKRVS